MCFEKTNNNGKNRNDLIDLLKAFAIIAVVVGHSIEYGSGQEVLNNELFYDNILFKFIYSFHMPLFMLISGYLFAYSVNKYSICELFVKKVNSLIVPIFSWAIISFSVSFLFRCLQGGTFPGINKIGLSFLPYFINNLWFLWALFWCSVIVLISKSMFNDSIWFYLLVFCSTFFLPNRNNIDLYSFMYPYFVLGYFSNKYSSMHRVLHRFFQKRRVIALWLLFILLLFFYTKKAYIYVSGHSIIHSNDVIWLQFFIDLYRLFIGFIGSIAIIATIRLVFDRIPLSFARPLYSLGKNTMGVYIISGFCFDERLWIHFAPFLNGVNYGVVLICSIIVICFSFFMTRLIQKSKIINVALLGGR